MKNSTNKKRGEITFNEYSRAEKTVIKLIQKGSNEYMGKEGKNLNKFTDTEGLIKIRTKLTLSDFPELTRSPYLLPAKHPVNRRRPLYIAGLNMAAAGHLQNHTCENFHAELGRLLGANPNAVFGTNNICESFHAELGRLLGPNLNVAIQKDSRDSLSGEDKFQYLLRGLTEDSSAQALVEKSPLSSENYRKSVDKLKKQIGPEGFLVFGLPHRTTNICESCCRLLGATPNVCRFLGKFESNNFMDIVNKLADMGIDLDSDLLSIIMLYSLPAAYENFRIAVESRDTLPKPEDHKIKILEESENNKHTKLFFC
ncbi:gag-polypeptide of LTR copia-type domain-containing protein [Phthorimaea operculella]|nr:gag-polypeptide of LTR copia-type domain-containing protein [Phthorimaea operculella]